MATACFCGFSGSGAGAAAAWPTAGCPDGSLMKNHHLNGATYQNLSKSIKTYQNLCKSMIHLKFISFKNSMNLQ
jgi:hypothetical protein